MMEMTLAMLRKKAGLTQKEVANNIGVAASTISKWENCVISLNASQFVSLCRLYDCKIDDVFLPYN